MSAQQTQGPRICGPVFDSTGRLMASVAAGPRCPEPVKGARCSVCGAQYVCLRWKKKGAAIAKATGEQA
jgi:hypothetical protein